MPTAGDLAREKLHRGHPSSLIPCGRGACRHCDVASMFADVPLPLDWSRAVAAIYARMHHHAVLR